MLRKTLLLFNTVKYLKVSQITNRIKRKLIKPRIDLSNAPELSIVNNNLVCVINHQQSFFGNNNFKFLNKEFNLGVKEDWNGVIHDKLWLYNLHYFDDLNAVESEKRNSWHCNLIQRWIDENPPGFGNGWEPYPLSLRVVNWIKWSLLNEDLKKQWLDSLTIQIKFLNKNLEYHLLGNHLFANAKALIFSGLYFHGPDADEWYQSGVRILNKELPEQVLADGGNFELSPMYHAIFLEDLLDIINIHQVYEKKLPFNIVTKAIQMLDWLKNMCHPDGEIAFFNDSTHSVAPTLAELVNYAKRLNIAYTEGHKNQLIHHKESGYIKVNKGELALIADVAEIGPSYIPGHGHADTLSFELSLFGERVIVNSGISTYESGSNRMKQRGTKSHSTITIDDTNSSEVWGGFRVAKRAKVFNLNINQKDNDLQFSACHDGYKNLNGKVIHCREWVLSGNFLEVKDNITGSGAHKISSVLPLHPAVEVSGIWNNSVELEIQGKKIRINFKGQGLLSVKKSHYYPEFGLLIENKQLIYNYNGNLPYKTSINISW
jgi:uncharacterized heparinase superfamily protein